jgi:PadR family transcriptional regulator, regulatory protein PadR
MARLNVTYPTGLVLQALARGFHYGFDIMDATNLPSGTVYPILRRLDREGLLDSTWEKHATAQKEQRPPRRYYDITPAGSRMLSAARQRYPNLEQAVTADGSAGRSPGTLKPSKA